MNDNTALRALMTAADPAHTASEPPPTTVIMARVRGLLDPLPRQITARTATRAPRRRWRPLVATAVAFSAVAVAAVLTVTAVATAPTASASIVLTRYDDAQVAALTLAQVPTGLAGPSISGNDDGTLTVYSAAAPSRDSVGISLTDDVRPGLRSAVSTNSGERVRVADSDAWVLRDASGDVDPGVYIAWRDTDGKWIELGGTGRYADVQRLASLAAGVNRLPGTALPIRMLVAPRGWVVAEFRHFDGAGAVDATETPQDLVRLEPSGAQSPESDRQVTILLYARVDDAFPADRPDGSVEAVDSRGRSGQLLHQDDGGWTLRLAIGDGRDLVMLYSDDFTRTQVLDLADGITST